MLKTAVLSMVIAGTISAQTVPLEASLRRSFEEPLVTVNQKAYVAVFEVIPGLGITQIYPRTAQQAETPIDAGEYLIPRPMDANYLYSGWSRAMPSSRPVYVVDGYGRVMTYYYATGYDYAGYPGSYPQNFQAVPTRTLLLVAAKQPLRNVSSAIAANRWLQQLVGFSAVANTITVPTKTLDLIVNAVAPAGALEEEVVVDVLDIHEQPARRGGQAIAMQCPGSLSLYAESQLYFSSGIVGCPYLNRNNYQHSTSGGTTATVPAPAAPPVQWEEVIKTPGRRRPNDNGMSDGFGRAAAGYTTVQAITYNGNNRGGVNPATGAWVPPTPSAAPGDYGWGAGRFSPAGSNYNAARTATNNASTSYNSGAGSSNVNSAGVTQSVNATVPGNSVGAGSAGARAASKPIDP